MRSVPRPSLVLPAVLTPLCVDSKHSCRSERPQAGQTWGSEPCGGGGGGGGGGSGGPHSPVSGAGPLIHPDMPLAALEVIATAQLSQCSSEGGMEGGASTLAGCVVVKTSNAIKHLHF